MKVIPKSVQSRTVGSLPCYQAAMGPRSCHYDSARPVPQIPACKWTLQQPAFLHLPRLSEIHRWCHYSTGTHSILSNWLVWRQSPIIIHADIPILCTGNWAVPPGIACGVLWDPWAILGNSSASCQMVLAQPKRLEPGEGETMTALNQTVHPFTWMSWDLGRHCTCVCVCVCVVMCVSEISFVAQGRSNIHQR